MKNILAGAAVGLLPIVLLVSAAAAVSTRHFSLDSAGVLSDGKLEGAAVLSSGAVVPSVGVRRIALPNVGVARSVLVQQDGIAYVGTGNDGKIYKLVGDVATQFAETKELLVTALATDGAGTLYAGTMPHGKVFAIDKQGKATVFAQPEGAEHIWALAYDKQKRTLFAGTGPKGQLFAIDAKGKADVYYTSKASHIMALALASPSELYAGTSDGAWLVRIEGPGRADVVYDFEGNEVTAIALRDRRIAVAANQFPKATPEKKKGDGKKDDQQSTDKTEVSKDAPKPGTGELWVVEASGQARKRWSSDEGQITAVQWADGNSGQIYAATGKGGRIYRVEQDGRNALWVDVDERQVLALALSGSAPLFVTGDAGAIYRVLPGNASEALWTSKVLDAQFASRFGQLTWRGEGKLSLRTRSGNSDKPDDGGWSDWSSPLAQPGPIRSPAGRFLQIRAKLDPQSQSTLYAVQAYYLPANQGVTLKDISVKPATPKAKDGAEETPSSTYKIDWKPENPDGDRLRYRLEWKPDGRAAWRPMLRESEILTKTTYDWDTSGVPDGYYRVRIEASDELDNPGPSALRERTESEPFLLDNHAPRVTDLRFAGGRLSGAARDELGPIAALEYAVDGQEFLPFYPKDDLFDTAEEPFDVALPALPKGSHVIAVRAKDARANVGSAELWIELK